MITTSSTRTKEVRYFKATYTTENIDNSVGTGSITFHVTGGNFFKRSELIEQIKDSLFPKPKNIIITNIFEFQSKEDFETFNQ